MTQKTEMPEAVWVTPVPEKNRFTDTNTTAWLFERLPTDVRYIRADTVAAAVRDAVERVTNAKNHLDSPYEIASGVNRDCAKSSLDEALAALRGLGK
jgi:hypothetical protein